VVAHGDGGDLGEAGVAHLGGRLPDDVEHVLVAELVDGGGELGLEEDEAEGVLVDLHRRVRGESLLLDDALHGLDRVVLVADLREDLGHLLGVLRLQCSAPAQVAGATLRVARAG
jgi:hypothetical protein